MVVVVVAGGGLFLDTPFPCLSRVQVSERTEQLIEAASVYVLYGAAKSAQKSQHKINAMSNSQSFLDRSNGTFHSCPSCVASSFDLSFRELENVRPRMLFKREKRANCRGPNCKGDGLREKTRWPPGGPSKL